MSDSKYVRYTENLKVGDVISTFKKGNLFSKLIWFVTRNKNTDPKISHNILYLGNGLIIESTIGNGVKIRTLRKYKVSEYDVKVKRTSLLTDEDKEEMYDFAIAQANELKYSYMQLFLNLIKAIFGLDKIGDYSKSQVVCSEFVCDCYRKVMINIGGSKISAEVSPLEVYVDKVFDIQVF